MIFKQQLEICTFKSYFDNQMQIVDYDSLFADQRTLVFSIPLPFGRSVKQLQRFDNSYDQLISLGINKIVCVSSDCLLIGPWANKQTSRIHGLADMNRQFVLALTQHYEINKPIDLLVRLWQYAVIIDNGVPEQLWHNNIKSDISWKVVKDRRFQFHGVHPEKVIEYLDNSTKE